MIKKLQKQLKKGGVTAEEAAFLIERLRDYGTAELEEAERLEWRCACMARTDSTPIAMIGSATIVEPSWLVLRHRR